MKILTKLMLASAVMVTSGFATGDVSEFQEGGTLEAGAKLEFESGGVLTMNADKSLHVYGSVEGDGQISCQGSGKVFVYAGAYAEDSTNAEAIKDATSSAATTVHTYDADAGGSIEGTVTVDPASSLVYVGPNLCEYASALDNTNLVYVANGDGISVRCAGGTDAASEIACELANADASIDTLTPASLVVENKVKFSGKNTGFTSGTVTYGTLENPTETEITSQDAFFPVESVVEQGSKLSLTATEGPTISKNLTVNGCNKWRLNDAEDEVVDGGNIGVLNVAGPVVVTNGACVKIKGKTAEPICEYPYEYPKVMSWPEDALPERFRGDKYMREYRVDSIEFTAFGLNMSTSLVFNYNDYTEEWTATEFNSASIESNGYVYYLDQVSISGGKNTFSVKLTIQQENEDGEPYDDSEVEMENILLPNPTATTLIQPMTDGIFTYTRSSMEPVYCNRVADKLFVHPGQRITGIYICEIPAEVFDASSISEQNKFTHIEFWKEGGNPMFVTYKVEGDKVNQISDHEVALEGNEDTGYYLISGEDEVVNLVGTYIDKLAKNCSFEEVWIDRDTYEALNNIKFR